MKRIKRVIHDDEEGHSFRVDSVMDGSGATLFTLKWPCGPATPTGTVEYLIFVEQVAKLHAYLGEVLAEQTE